MKFSLRRSVVPSSNQPRKSSCRSTSSQFRKRSTRRLLLEGLEDRRLMAIVGRVVEDGVPLGGVNNGDVGSSPSAVVDIGGTVYFAAEDSNGFELWRAGPNGVAQLVEDSVPGGGIAAGSASSNPAYLTNFNGTLFFTASDGLNGIELWKVGSSGVAEMVSGAAGIGINPGVGSAYPRYFQQLDGFLYFQATDGLNGAELWRTSLAGPAEMVEDAVVGGGIRAGTLGSEPKYLTSVGGELFFQANDGVRGTELWRVQNGGVASLVEDSIPGGGLAPGYQDSNPNSLYNFGGTLYFVASNELSGTELWRISGGGIAALVEDAVPGDGLAVGSNNSYPSYLTASNGTLYFQASNEDNGSELWRIGMGGIAEVVELGPVPGGGINSGSLSSSPAALIDVAGTFYFRAKNEDNGYELWRVNNQGFAEQVDDSVPGPGIAPGSVSSSPIHLTNVNGILFFSADDGSRGVELWRVPGTGFAEIVEDEILGGGIEPGAGSSNPEGLINVAGRLYFGARNGAQGLELWQIDNSGVARVVDRGVAGDGINPGAADSRPTRLANANGTLYFAANDGTHGEELWKVNSSLAAEQINVSGRVEGINADSANADPNGLTLLDGTLYFVATDGTNGKELWRLNNLGVAELVEDSVAGGGLRPGFASSHPRDLVSVNGTVYFNADTANGIGLWKILPNGVAQLIVETLSSGGVDRGATSPRSGALTNAGGTLYFVAADGANGNELWRVNAGGLAELVEDAVPGGGLNSGASSSNPRQLINIGGTLYFTAENAASGDELWRVNSGGTAELVEDGPPNGGIYTGTYGSAPAHLTDFNGLLYFQANDGTNGRELWRVNSSGVAELVEDSVPLGGISASFSSYPSYLTVVGGTLYFQANDSISGNELWRVPAATGIAELVEDSVSGGGINPGLAGSNPREITNVNGTAYFRATTAAEGNELWRVNASGVAEIVEDALIGGGIRPGTNSSAPGNLANMGGTLYFQANDGTNGFELWRINGAGNAELVEDILPGGGIAIGPEGSYPTNLTSINGTIYFTAEDAARGMELFTIDNQGLAVSVSGESGNGEILPGPGSAAPKFLTNVNGVLYFSANAGRRFGTELMRLLPNNVPTLTRLLATVNGDVSTTLTNSGTWSDADGDSVQLTASLGTVVKNANGTWDWSFTANSKLTNQLVQITATDIQGDSMSVSFTVNANVRVLDRKIFYNRAVSSVFGNGTGNPVGSIDPTKSALLPGESTSFANISNYQHGLNGIVVDIAGLGAATTAADLQFATWNGIDTAGFVPTTATPTVTLLPGAGANGSTRLKIEFDNSAIRNTWLRVTIQANANTMLDNSDVFYFGSAVAEMDIGNIVGPPITIRVNATDTSTVRQNQSTFPNSANISSKFDLNKDGRVNSTDTSIVRQNQLNPVIRYFTAPSNFLALSESLSLSSTATPAVESNVVKSDSAFSLASSRSSVAHQEDSTTDERTAAVPFVGPVLPPPPIETARWLASRFEATGVDAALGEIGWSDALVWNATDRFFSTYR